MLNNKNAEVFGHSNVGLSPFIDAVLYVERFGYAYTGSLAKWYAVVNYNITKVQ